MTLLSSGDRISDTLVVDRLLGEGAFAEVHRVRHDYLGLQAMKVFKRVASLDKTRELLGEARLLSTLGHPHIVRLFDANTVQTPEGLRGYFTMEYVSGGSLEQLLYSHRPGVPVDIAVEVIEQIADGLSAAHGRTPPIVHRDLTLANVLVGYDTGADGRPRVRISDFGLAKRTDPITMLASAQGTYAFMAPEVMRYQGYSCASDVYSVGTIAYVLLTNHFPYEDPHALSSFSLARFGRTLLPPSRFNDDVDAELDRIVLATLRLEPGDRPADAGALVDMLRAWEGRPARPASPTRRARGPDEDARELAKNALERALHPDGLPEATALMERAMELDPSVRDRYLSKLALWRRGVIM